MKSFSPFRNGHLHTKANMPSKNYEVLRTFEGIFIAVTKFMFISSN